MFLHQENLYGFCVGHAVYDIYD